MFDVGFWELVVIAVVALIVFGPDKLPGLARTLGFWAGRARRQLAAFRQQVEREMAFEEMQRLQEQLRAAASTTPSIHSGNIKSEVGDKNAAADETKVTPPE
jgi:sec-independent protein translocase protein TatB